MSHPVRFPGRSPTLERGTVVRVLLLVLATVATPSVLAGCGGEGGGEEDDRPRQEAEAPAADPEPAPRIQGDTVVVEMDEYLIDLPDPLPAGRLVFRVTNMGFEEHNLEVHRDSLLWELDRPLNPRETRTMNVVLEPGSYRLICTVSGHEGRGMTEGLTVVEDPDSP